MTDEGIVLKLYGSAMPLSAEGDIQVFLVN